MAGGEPGFSHWVTFYCELINIWKNLQKYIGHFDYL